MKLPLAFSLTTAVRILLPGVVVGCFLMPVVTPLLDAMAMSNYLAGFVTTALLAGWLFTVLDIPVYSAWSGTRFWPRWLARRSLARERRRCEAAVAVIRTWEAYSEAERETAAQDPDEWHAYVEASRVWRSFPKMESQLQSLTRDEREEGLKFRVTPSAKRPTRLGNLFLTIQEYPRLVYGMDGVFYWHRLWLQMDGGARSNLDEAQAMADGSLYVATGLALGSGLSVLYAVVAWFRADPILDTVLFWPGLEWWQWLWVGLGSVIASRLVYRGGMSLHQAYGDLYKAAFDTWVDAVELSTAERELRTLQGEPEVDDVPARTRRRDVWRFLSNYRY